MLDSRLELVTKSEGNVLPFSGLSVVSFYLSFSVSNLNSMAGEMRS